MDALKKADIELEKELHKQIALNYGTICIALHDQGWGTQKLKTLLDRTAAYWHTCGEDNSISMLEMLENETGIEIRHSETGKSWHDLPYINGKIKTGKLTRAQWIYMRQRQREWVGAQCVACILYTLHRRYGWGIDRASRLLEESERLKDEYRRDAEKIREACRTIAGVRLIDE